MRSTLSSPLPALYRPESLGKLVGTHAPDCRAAAWELPASVLLKSLVDCARDLDLEPHPVSFFGTPVPVQARTIEVGNAKVIHLAS